MFVIAMMMLVTVKPLIRSLTGTKWPLTILVLVLLLFWSIWINNSNTEAIHLLYTDFLCYYLIHGFVCVFTYMLYYLHYCPTHTDTHYWTPTERLPPDLLLLIWPTGLSNIIIIIIICSATYEGNNLPDDDYDNNNIQKVSKHKTFSNFWILCECVFYLIHNLIHISFIMMIYFIKSKENHT